MNLPYQLILASKSPRRKDLLEALGFKFSIETYPVAEDFDDSMQSEEVAEFLANKKSLGFRELKENELLITSDTVVISDNKVLVKPSDREDAIAMISGLSDRSHAVISGVCLRTLDKTVSFSVSTEVVFSNLESDEITHYVDAFQPYDKAGAYGIQEWIGMIGIASLKGDYYNVVGLPLHELYQTLKREFSA